MSTPPLPALFIGHGSPMNALELNSYTRVWQDLGRSLPRPRAILCISAHWYIRHTAVTAQADPPTIHDFYGFPQELFAFRYPSPGSAALVERVQQLVTQTPVQADSEWGIDHGAWSVLTHLYPQADIPVVQLSIDATRPPAWHYELGRTLSPLRDEGILIVGSGNVVHNLRQMRRDGEGSAWNWATSFNDQARRFILDGDHQPLQEYLSLGEGARLSVPTPEHYLPLLYVLGTQRPGEQARIVTDGIDLAAISMLSTLVGETSPV